MQITLVVVGRLRAGPELSLIDDYSNRFNKIGRAHGLRPLNICEVEDRKGSGKAGEADAIKRAIPEGAFVVALDERGKVQSSPEFSQKVVQLRDDGQSDLCFVIGGAAGLDPEFVKSANQVLSFGKMVWPHMLARVMLVEQLYRCANIMAGTPYHRE